MSFIISDLAKIDRAHLLLPLHYRTIVHSL